MANGLERVGNFESYVHTPRRVAPAGVCWGSKLVLKVYDMYILGHAGNPVLDAHNFLEQEVSSGKLSPLSGLGFAIVSKDMINAVRWDDKNPIVMHNQLYEYNPENLIATARKLDINECGSFCIWEAGIVAHEKDEWIKYLTSRKTEQDKRDYLYSFISGGLDPQ